MQHNSFITSTNLRQHVVANKPTNKYKRCMSSHKTILCHRVFFFWPNPKYFSADYPAASVCCQNKSMCLDRGVLRSNIVCALELFLS